MYRVEEKHGGIYKVFAKVNGTEELLSFVDNEIIPFNGSNRIEASFSSDKLLDDYYMKGKYKVWYLDGVWKKLPRGFKNKAHALSCMNGLRFLFPEVLVVDSETVENYIS
jgi:hypothetical protein